MQEEDMFPKRRSILALGGSLVTGLLASAPPMRADDDNEGDNDSDDKPTPADKELASKIEDIIEAQGMFSNGVFSIEIDRDDIPYIKLHGVPILPSFEINGTLYFQFRGDGKAIMNADIALRGREVDPFIDQLLANNLVFQAEHQHFYDFDPLVWFIHFRAAGDALEIAKGTKAALSVTSTPFPQTMPSNPTTPLPADELGQIIGASPEIGSDGVVTFDVPRKDFIYLGGHHINPYLNVATSIVFQPYGGGINAAAAPDFGMVASEIQKVVAVMRGQGWDIGCLYNQETAEHPQLFFSHQFKTGDSIELAHEIRKGLDQMYVKFE